MIQLEVTDLDIGYCKSKPIASELTFSINRGDYICIIGENGTGKSTLIKTILGLQKKIFGDINFHVKKSDISYLPQQDEIQRDFPATVFEIVLSGCLNRIKWYEPFYSSKEKEFANSALKDMGIHDLANKSYKELSGGQQERVLLARALVNAEEMIFLDEPTLNLDDKSANEMYKCIKNINEKGVTVVMVSHDCDKALKFATHIIDLTSPEKGCFPIKGGKKC